MSEKIKRYYYRAYHPNNCDRLCQTVINLKKRDDEYEETDVCITKDVTELERRIKVLERALDLAEQKESWDVLTKYELIEQAEGVKE